MTSNVSATTDGDVILLRIPPPWEIPSYHRKIKDGKVPGARWNPDEKAWNLALTQDNCRLLRRVFGSELKVMPQLAAWYIKAQERIDELERMRAGLIESETLDNVREMCPDLYMAMDARKYQVAGTAFLSQAKAAILGDQPGLGKTLQAIATMVQHDCQRILVACPRTATRTVWEDEVARWAPHIAVFVSQGGRPQRQKAMDEYAASDGPKMLVINWEMVRAKKIEIPYVGRDGEPKVKYAIEPKWPFLFEQEWDAMVFDESHNLLASTANIGSKRITQGRLGAIYLRKRIRKGGLALALSGTPERSDLLKLWGQLNWCREDVFGSFWRFAETHFGVEDGEYGKIIGGGKKNPAPLDDEAWDAAIRPFFLQRTKAEVAPDLPPVQYAGTERNPGEGNAVWLEMDKKQADAYEQMVKDAEVHLESGTLLATGVLAEITRLRQFANSYGSMVRGQFVPTLPSAKAEWLEEFLSERNGHQGKILVASEFTEFIEMLARHLGGNEYDNRGRHTGPFGPILTLTGKTSDKDRALLVKRFNDPDDDCRVAIINMHAGGEAITLDKACDDLVVTDLPWKESVLTQVVNRIHRISRIHNVTVYRLLSVNTIEAWLFGLNEQQRAIVEASRPEVLDMYKEALR